MRNGVFEDRDTAKISGPGPFMVTFLSITSSALVNVMVCPWRAAAKSMRSPSSASASAWRNERGPLSWVLMTVRGGNGRGCGVGRGLRMDEPMAQLLALEDIVGCARIAAAQTSNAPIATNRNPMAFVLIRAPGCAERFRKFSGQSREKQKRNLIETRPRLHASRSE